MDRLVDDLWPGDVPDSARHTLHVHLSMLRSALGPDRERLARHGSGYRFEIGLDELDATLFLQLVTDGRAALNRGDAEGARSLLQEALGLWRGPVLADIAGESFVHAEATRLGEIKLVALELGVDADLELGNHDVLVEGLLNLVDLHPFRERFWEQLMLALYRCGRQAEALRVFQEARTQLVEELGIEPGPALRRLEERILNQDPGLDLTDSSRLGAAADTLPHLRTSFIGRERELDLGRGLLADSRLLTLTGPPGSGKTRMAIQLATEHLSAFPDGVFFVALAAVGDVHLVDTTIAKTLGLRDVPDEAPIDGLKGYLRDRRALLVLDNFEQILEAAPLVGDLLDTAPDLTILVTSRSPLELSGEQEFPIAPLTVPAIGETLTLDNVNDYDAVALFLARSRASHPAFTIDAGNAVEIAEITARLDGLPLAIELAAARMKLLTPGDLLARMRDHRPVLADGPADVAQRHRTLRDAIAWSYDVLEPGEQMLFRRLGVFHTFALDAAMSITGLPETSVFDGVDSLLSKSLVYRNDIGGHARFGMLETLREFALGRLEAADERDEIVGRHAAYFRRLAEESEMQLTRDSAHDTIQMLTVEIDNIRNALRHAINAGNADLGISLAGSIWRFFQSTGRLVEGRQWLETLLAMPGASDAARAKGLTGLAGLAYWHGNYDEASLLYEDALACYRAVGDRFGEADTLFGMSMSVAVHGDSDRGERLASEARSMFEELGSREKIGQVYMAQAALMHVKGRHTDARSFWEAALGIARELGDHQLAVTELIGIGICEYHNGNLDEALRIALESLDAAADLENVQVAIWLLDYIAAFSVSSSPSEAVRLAGAVDALRRGAGGGMSFDAMGVEDARTVASQTLTPDNIHEAWSKGRAMTLEEAIDYARGFDRLLRDDAGSQATH